MELVSVNIGSEWTQPKGNEIETTGIYKLPTRAPVEITTLGIREDFICDQKNHSGPDQAIYVCGAADYVRWSKEWGREIEAGTFGENLTVSELESAHVNVGDRLTRRNLAGGIFFI
ncbi:MAG: MOSC domain-containing protein [Chloroflexi bacterium]|nr:MOSC domain-containing protein [Chloroflexota bacterium]